MLQPHHDGSPLYVSTDAAALGDRVAVRVRIPASWPAVESVHVRSNPDREPRWSVATLVAADEHWDWWEAQVVVENPEHGYRFLISGVDGRDWWLNQAGVSEVETLDSDDFTLLTYAPPPAWGRSTVMYQIFPDRFARSASASARALPEWAEPAAWTDEPIHIGPSTARQFYGGDLQGIIDHLDHLERLGVTMIYLTPVFPARSNHRYDALSFDEVDPLLGGDAALAALTAAAHERGFTIIGDLTSNHSGDAHEWFRTAVEQPDSIEREFYYWFDAAEGHHHDYVSWLGVPSLPKFNWASRELRRRFIEGADSVVAKWLEPPYSFDGWRIDVANMTGRYLAEDLNTEVRRTIRETMVAVNENTLLLGESTNDATTDFQGDGWHGAMTYANFTRPLWNWLSVPGSLARGGLGMPLGRTTPFTGHDFYRAHRRFTATIPWRVRLHTMNALDTHDTPRFRTSAIEGAVPVAFGLSVTLPGIPVVFAGDEFGLVGEDGEHSRSPIPWDDVDAAADTIDAYAELIHLRRAHLALNDGGLRWLHVEDDALVFVREHATESVLVVAARAAVDFTLPDGALGAAGSADARLALGQASLDGTRIVTDGPSFTAWVLPGVSLPAFLLG